MLSAYFFVHLSRLFSGLNHPIALSLTPTPKQQTDSVITIIFFPFSPASMFLLHSCFPLFEVMMNCLLLVSFFPQQTSGGEERLKMCVAVKKKLQLYYWKDREFHELQVKKKKKKLDSLQCDRGRTLAPFIFILLFIRETLVFLISQSPWPGVKTPYVLGSSGTTTLFGYVQIEGKHKCAHKLLSIKMFTHTRRLCWVI